MTSARSKSLLLRSAAVVSFAASLACGPSPQAMAPPRQGNPDSAAGKVGQAAHKAAVEVDKEGRVIGRKIDKAAHDAHAGWKEAARSDSSRK